MVFASILFLFYFLPAVLLGYFLLPARPRIRNLFLFIVSLIFYVSGEAWFVLLMLASALVDFICGGIIEWEFQKAGLPLERRPKFRRTALQRAALLCSLFFNLGALGFFKYFYFTVDNYNAICSLFGLDLLAWHTTLQITLPLGISFYTFQTLSYTLDIYRGHVVGTRRLIDFSCFVTMFPQLIAGPIVRYNEVQKELRERRITLASFAEGAALFIVGLGKKVLFANILAEPTDRIYAIPHDQIPMGLAWIGAVFFTLQLFFDFAGYSDMARGMGRMFGFNFPVNFNYPYISRTVAEAWTRWHITLSYWLRDYLFLPLGGYRRGRLRSYMNLMIVFALCGLWHGASWNFVLFASLHGACIVFERIIKAQRRAFFKSYWACPFYGYLVLLISLVLFRTDTLADAGRYFRAMAGLAPAVSPEHTFGCFVNAEVAFAFFAALLGCAPFIPWLNGLWSRLVAAKPAHATGLEALRSTTRVLLLAAVFLLSVMKLASGTYNPFIYFRF